MPCKLLQKQCCCISPSKHLPAPFQPYGKSKHDAIGKGWGGYEGETQVLLAFPGVRLAQGDPGLGMDLQPLL